MVLNNKNKGLIVFLAVVILTVIGGLVFYFVGKQAAAESLAYNQENRELLKDSLYHNYTTRSLAVAEVHGFVKSVKVECTDMNSSPSFDIPSPFNSVWYSFDKNGEMDSLYNDKALVTHQGARSIIASKIKIEGGEYCDFDDDHLRYDIFDFVFNGEHMASTTYSRIECDDVTGILDEEVVVDYADFKDNRYHKRSITQPMYYGSIKTSIDYTYTKTDSMGNWTERIGQVTTVYSYSPNEIKKSKVKETRTISYYEKKDLDLEKLLEAKGSQESTNSEVYSEINRVQRLVKNSEIQANQDQYEARSEEEEYNRRENETTERITEPESDLSWLQGHWRYIGNDSYLGNYAINVYFDGNRLKVYYTKEYSNPELWYNGTYRYSLSSPYEGYNTISYSDSFILVDPTRQSLLYDRGKPFTKVK